MSVLSLKSQVSSQVSGLKFEVLETSDLRLETFPVHKRPHHRDRPELQSVDQPGAAALREHKQPLMRSNGARPFELPRLGVSEEIHVLEALGERILNREI